MDSGLERLFRLREERDMETDAELKIRLHKDFFSNSHYGLVNARRVRAPGLHPHKTASCRPGALTRRPDLVHNENCLDFLSEVRRFVGEKQLPINAWEF